MSSQNIIKLVVAVAASQLAGVIGSLFTFSAIPTWYAGLVRPPLSPPNWVFGPVWTTLYLLMGIAAFLVWRQGWAKKEVRYALTIFLAQLVLNSLWSIIFFGFHNPLLAFCEIILLWLTILWTAVEFRHVSRPAAFLMVPYILWVSFAAYLNFAIWFLN